VINLVEESDVVDKESLETKLDRISVEVPVQEGNPSIRWR
jgi:hypothetical protein